MCRATHELWINARPVYAVYVRYTLRRTLHARAPCVHEHNARCRSTPNIYTSIRLRRVEALTDVARRRLNRAPSFVRHAFSAAA